MPCIDCDTDSIQTSFQTHYIIHSGGPSIAQYVALRLAIPARDERIVLQYGWPKVTDQGHLVYEGGQVPPVPEGWEVVEPTMLRPIWPECINRALRAQMQETGCLRIEGVCSDARTGYLNKALTLDACRHCSYRRQIKGDPCGSP